MQIASDDKELGVCFMTNTIKTITRISTSKRMGVFHRQDKNAFNQDSLSWNMLLKPKSLSLGMLLFLIGFNLMYFLPLIYPKTLFENEISGSYRYYALAWTLISLGGLLEALQRRLLFFRRKPLWTLLAVFTIIMLVSRSYFSGDPLSIIIQRISPFLWILLLPSIGLWKENWKWLWLTFLVQAAVSLPYTLNAFFFQGLVTRSAIINFEGQNFLAISFYMAVFVFLMLPTIRNRSLRIISIVLFVNYLMYSLFFARRLVWFLLPFYLIGMVFIYFRSRTKQKGFSFRLAIDGIVITTIFTLLFFVNTSSFSSDLSSMVETGYDGLLDRMFIGGTIQNTILENERLVEFNIVVSKMSGLDWLVGKGINATWRSTLFASGQQRYMVHNTWLNSFYWGGLFLFLVVTWPILWGLRILITERNITTLGYALFVVLTYLTFPSYLVTYVTHEWILFSIALGAIIGNAKPSERLKNPGSICR